MGIIEAVKRVQESYRDSFTKLKIYLPSISVIDVLKTPNNRPKPISIVGPDGIENMENVWASKSD